jgi:prevent-host-death family protein
MMDLTKDIQSLTTFKRNTTELVRQVKESGRPLVLTINGKAELVVQDAGSFQKLIELVDRLEAIEGIKRGIESFERGEGIPLEELDRRLRKKHGLAR